MKVFIPILLGVTLFTSIGTIQYAAALTPSNNYSYAALGDSVASGDGLNSYTNNVCKRSTNGYPEIIAKKEGFQLTNLSCSGAQIRSGLISPQENSQDANIAPSQIDTAFSNGVPKIITITVGANNMRWYDFFSYCQSSSCSGSGFYQYFSSIGTTVLRGVVQAELPYSLSKINYLSALQHKKPPKIYITGYYSPLSTNTSCLGTNAITAAQASWFQYQVAALNTVLQRTANLYSNVQFVPIDFTGHELCSAHPWIQPLTGNAPIHPNQIGQQKIADSIASALDARQ